jgi:hypothetical protein
MNYYEPILISVKNHLLSEIVKEFKLGTDQADQLLVYLEIIFSVQRQLENINKDYRGDVDIAHVEKVEQQG